MVSTRAGAVVNRNWRRWLPAFIAPVLVAAGALIVPFAASASIVLPVKTPEQVLTMIGQSSVRAFSGTLEQTSQLGLPSLPAGLAPTTSTSSMLDLLTGAHTARVYLDGPTKVRVQLMDTLAERDLVRHGNEVWFYNSHGNVATRLTIPAGAAGKAPSLPHTIPTPAQLAKELLTGITPSTQVSIGTNTAVAGRTAYDLILTPRGGDTLVGSVSVAVDSATGLPLSVVIRARGQVDPAFRLAFSALSLQTPSADRFVFVPPAGATVKQGAPAHLPGAVPPSGKAVPFSGDAPAVSGSGWDSVVELPAGTGSALLTGSKLPAGVATAVPGGRLLSTSLLTVLVTTDGRVFAGAVPAARLLAAAGR